MAVMEEIYLNRRRSDRDPPLAFVVACGLPRTAAIG